MGDKEKNEKGKKTHHIKKEKVQKRENMRSRKESKKRRMREGEKGVGENEGRE